MSNLSLFDFDPNPNAVLNPNYEHLGYQFAPKLVLPFVSAQNFHAFLASQPHHIAGYFETFACRYPIYQVNYHHQPLTLVRPPLGASAATQLVDWLIAYGVKTVLAIGSCGALTASNEGDFFLPTKALRDEGTSFHYVAASRYITLTSPLVAHVARQLATKNIAYQKVTTWTTDGFFRETKTKLQKYLAAGITVVEMECAALAACCQMRDVEFAQILYSADSLANFTHDARNWGQARQAAVMGLACDILAEY